MSTILETEITETVEIACHEDGSLVNMETGEIVGYEGAPFVPPPGDGAAGARAQALRDAVLWATERRARATARMAGLTHERDQLVKGVIERYESMIAEERRRIEWIDANYRPAMMEFAAGEVEGGKAKSVKLPWATLGFRASKGALQIDDPAAAAYTLIESGCPAAVTFEIEIDHLAEGDERAKAVREALLGSFDLRPGAWDLPLGIAPRIHASAVPDSIPDTVTGVRRSAPEHPLGNFQVKH